MAVTIKKGWLFADTERVRLAAVIAYRPYSDNALEIITANGARRFDLTGALEPQPALEAPGDDGDPARKRNRRKLDDWSARQLRNIRTAVEAALAALDDYFLKNP